MKTYNAFFGPGDKKLSCSCGCGGTVTDERLIWILTAVREHFGKPVVITSGFRCEAYNRKVGGAAKSQHLTGKAVDFNVQGVSPKEVQAYLDKLLAGRFGLGYGKTFTHLDTRDNPARFNY